MKRLEAGGYGVWLDRTDITGGNRWRDSIELGLNEADVVIFLISQRALESDEVYKELARAIELGKPIIPLRVDDTPLFGWYKEKLGSLQHIEIEATDESAKWWDLLADALHDVRRNQLAAAEDRSSAKS
jgi:hypothetical protein